jgi:hypothetical protein
MKNEIAVPDEMMFNPFARERVAAVGDRFDIVHCDGYIAHEVIDKIVYVPEGDYNHYICASCAAYNDRDIIDHAYNIQQ